MKLTITKNGVIQALSVLSVGAIEFGKVLPEGEAKQYLTLSLTALSGLIGILAHNRTPEGDVISKDSEALKKATEKAEGR